MYHSLREKKGTPQHTATHCNTLQHTATHCNTLQHTVWFIYVTWLVHLWHVTWLVHLWHNSCITHSEREEEHCNTLQHTATHCNTLQHTATHSLRHAYMMCICDVTYSSVTRLNHELKKKSRLADDVVSVQLIWCSVCTIHRDSITNSERKEGLADNGVSVWLRWCSVCTLRWCSVCTIHMMCSTWFRSKKKKPPQEDLFFGMFQFEKAEKEDLPRTLPLFFSSFSFLFLTPAIRNMPKRGPPWGGEVTTPPNKGDPSGGEGVSFLASCEQSNWFLLFLFFPLFLSPLQSEICPKGDPPGWGEFLAIKVLISNVTHVSLQHNATHCNTLQHTATHCTTHCNTHSIKVLISNMTHVSLTHRKEKGLQSHTVYMIHMCVTWLVHQ